MWGEKEFIQYSTELDISLGGMEWKWGMASTGMTVVLGIFLYRLTLGVLKREVFDQNLYCSQFLIVMTALSQSKLSLIISSSLLVYQVVVSDFNSRRNSLISTQKTIVFLTLLCGIGHYYSLNSWSTFFLPTSLLSIVFLLIFILATWFIIDLFFNDNKKNSDINIVGLAVMFGLANSFLDLNNMDLLTGCYLVIVFIILGLKPFLSSRKKDNQLSLSLIMLLIFYSVLIKNQELAVYLVGLYFVQLVTKRTLGLNNTFELRGVLTANLCLFPGTPSFFLAIKIIKILLQSNSRWMIIVFLMYWGRELIDILTEKESNLHLSQGRQL